MEFEPVHIIFLVALGVFWFGLIFISLCQLSRWSELVQKFSVGKVVPIKLAPFQGGVLNDIFIKGLFSLGATDKGVYIKLKNTIFIPYSEIEMMNQKKGSAFELFKIKGSDLTIGLPLWWINKIKKHLPTSQVNLHDERPSPR